MNRKYKRQINKTEDAHLVDKKEHQLTPEPQAPPARHPWILAFTSGIFFTLLLAIGSAGLYLFYFDGKLQKLVQLQVAYFEKQVTTFSGELFTNIRQDLSQHLETEIARIESEFQDRLTEQGQTFTKHITAQLLVIEQETHNAFDQASKKLITDIPTTIKNKLLEERNAEIRSAQQGVLLAENLLAENKPARASLFFSNAINKDPGNIVTLTKYTVSVIEWCKNQVKEGDLGVALDVINETDLFLRAQAVSVHPQDIPQLEELITTMDKTRSGTQKRILETNKTLATSRATELSAEGEALLQNPTPTVELSLIEYIDKLQRLSNEIQTLQDVENLISNGLLVRLEMQIKHISVQLDALSTLSMLEDNMMANSIESDSPGLAFYRISTLNSVAQQLAKLQPEVSHELSVKIDLAYICRYRGRV